ncbi:MAG: hypothetical protein KY455_09535 [Euryarchaeota archaeon]|nr:hypothetical protein [Euryarchaeota archaeon]
MRLAYLPHWVTPAAAGVVLLWLWVERWRGRLPSVVDAPVFLFAVALLAAWFAGRPPWASLVGTVIWGGALLLVVGVPQEWNRARPDAPLAFVFVVGVAVAAGVGVLAGHAERLSLVSLVLLVGIGRIVAWRMTERHGVLLGAAFTLAAAVPFFGGGFGLLVVGIEALGLVLAWPFLEGRSGWPWVLGALGVVVGMQVGL